MQDHSHDGEMLSKNNTSDRTWRELAKIAEPLHCVLIARIDLNCKTPEQLFEQVARELQFPSYFGKNWDALLDCLRDLSWFGSRDAYVFLLTHPGTQSGLSSDDRRTLEEVLQDARSWWLEQGKPFLVMKLFLPDVP